MSLYSPASTSPCHCTPLAGRPCVTVHHWLDGLCHCTPLAGRPLSLNTYPFVNMCIPLHACPSATFLHLRHSTHAPLSLYAWPFAALTYACPTQEVPAVPHTHIRCKAVAALQQQMDSKGPNERPVSLDREATREGGGEGRTPYSGPPRVRPWYPFRETKR